MSAQEIPAKTSSPERPAQQRGLRIGNPGNKGGGNIPDTLREWHANLLRDPKVRQAYEAILRDKEHPHFLRAFQNSEERVDGKVPTPVALEGAAQLTIRVVRERRAKR